MHKPQWIDVDKKAVWCKPSMCFHFIVLHRKQMIKENRGIETRNGTRSPCHTKENSPNKTGKKQTTSILSNSNIEIKIDK